MIFISNNQVSGNFILRIVFGFLRRNTNGQICDVVGEVLSVSAKLLYIFC